MPYDLMSFFASGANAMAAPDISRANQQAAQLQQQYAPQIAQQEAQQSYLKTEQQKLTVQQLQTTIGLDQDARKATQDYFQKNPDKPLDEAYKDLAKIVAPTNPKLAEKFATDSYKMEEQKARATKETAEAHEHLIEAAQRGLDMMDPADPQSINKAIMDITQAGIDPSKFIKELQLFGPEQAINHAKENMKTFRQKKEERQAHDAEAKAEREDKKLDETRRKDDMSARRMEALVSNSARTETRALVSNLNTTIDNLNGHITQAEKVYRDKLDFLNIPPENKDDEKARRVQAAELEKEMGELKGRRDNYQRQLETYMPSEKNLPKPISKAPDKPTYTQDKPATPSSKDDFNQLKSGDIYVNPANGKLYKKK